MSSDSVPEKRPEHAQALSHDVIEGIQQAVSTTSRLESAAAATRITFKLVREIGRTASPPLSNPITLAIHPAGHYLVLERPTPNSFRLRQFRPSGELDGDPVAFEMGSGDTELTDPTGLAIDREHQIYIPDSAAGCVKKFTADGRWLDTLWSGGPDNDPFDAPSDVDVDEAGNIYIADTNNNRVVQLLPDGNLGWVLDQFPGAPQDSEPDEFYEPHSVCAGRDGSIVVADTNQNRILRFDSQRRLIARIAGENLFEFPSEVRISRDGTTIYAADCNNMRVRRFDPSGNITGSVRVAQGGTDQGPVIGGGDIDIDEHGNVVMINPLRQSVIVLEFVEP